MINQTFFVSNGRFSNEHPNQVNQYDSFGNKIFSLKNFQLADYSLSFPNRSGPKVSQLIRKSRRISRTRQIAAALHQAPSK